MRLGVKGQTTLSHLLGLKVSLSPYPLLAPFADSTMFAASGRQRKVERKRDDQGVEDEDSSQGEDLSDDEDHVKAKDVASDDMENLDEEDEESAVTAKEQG